MKERLRILFIAFLLTVITLPHLKAQGDVTDFLQFGQENAATFTNLYLSPFGQAVGNNMNNGWFNTGQAHRLGRFDFRIGIPITFAGESVRNFTFQESDFTGITLVDPNDNLAPTLFGDDTPGPMITYHNEQFALPQGTGYHILPLVPPSLQLNIGLLKATEVMFRYVPEINVRDFSTSMYGFGLKHGIKQHIPGMRYLPFDLSLIMAWSKFNANYGLNYNPENDANIDVDEQKLDITARAFNLNLIASKKLAVITFFGGVRYMHSSTDFLIAGDYPVASGTFASDPIVLNNPVDVNMKGGQVGLNGGFRLQLGFISFFADATLAKYSSVNAGMSLGFHN